MDSTTQPQSTSTDEEQPTNRPESRSPVGTLFGAISRVPTQYIAAGTAFLLLVIVATTLAAAQEFCDDPAGQLLIAIETMLINYGTTLLFLAFLIGVAMWGLTPIFAGQSAIGLTMVLLSFGAHLSEGPVRTADDGTRWDGRRR